MADETKPESQPGQPIARPAPQTNAAAKPAAPAAKPAPKAAPGPPLPVDPPPAADLEPPAFIKELAAAVPGVQLSYWLGDWTVIVQSDRLLDVATFLRDSAGGRFDYCSDVSAIDWPARPEQRFDVVYCLYSTSRRQRVRMKTRTGETQPVPSVTSLWPAANWLEREVFDMFGVRFSGHPDLRRILMPEEWQGHPQRKDYPLEGPGEMILEDPQEWLKLAQTEEGSGTE
jgi:NADH-quinone oxidoreductase subunit C